ncbi:MAG: cache domain-containing protein [SAR324 cluster bacterium]|nr:cache domain-containing protein [SAR324 cluster bacterium]
MKSKKLLLVLAMTVFFLVSSSVYAVDRDKEIAALADKAIAHILKVGRNQAFQDFADRKGEFFNGEVYIVVLDMDGINTFHPVNPRLVGKNFMNFKDTDGTLFIQEITSNLKQNGVTWVEYNWVNPIKKKVAKKRALAKMIDKKEYVLIGYWP